MLSGRKRSRLAGLLLWGWLGAVTAAPSEGETVLLQVDDLSVSAQAFGQLAAQEARERFYHFNPPQAEKEAFYRDLLDRLIDQKLLSDEAERRGVVPDGDYVMQRLVAIERSYKKGAERWAEELPEITAQLNAQAAVQALRESVEAQVNPSDEEVRAFYENNLELFVEPARYRVGLILLAVQPWERNDAWQAAEEEAKALVQALKEGQDFAELAREVSDDPTAEAGGDMGYLHQGMLGNQIQQTVVDLEKVGDIADPVRVLEGIAIVKLLDKEESSQRSFDQVEERARSLLVRKLQTERWEALKTKLRSEADIDLNEALLAEILAS